MKIPSTEEMPGLTRKEREHMAHLIRRRNFLIDRIENSDENLSWDMAELGALNWAVETLSNLIPEDDTDRAVNATEGNA